MTLGEAAASQPRLIVWSRKCGHQVEPDPAEMAARYGAETPVLDWRDDQLRWSDQLGMAQRERAGLLRVRWAEGRAGPSGAPRTARRRALSVPCDKDVFSTEPTCINQNWNVFHPRRGLE